ncbi:hypothetical protein PPTG_03081 [Plasmopara halstedii]|uniref:Chitin-binding type-4 domain-containing protein n=1 Tax=Plasmopara halstedii TaxID=4781 RepID=A0A0P1ADF6_PLAHL|nr:hypothetical protein PPTG_03081 [Plasmopara halstedii]CEG38487.1 hypothetical protein PPTG_03081 [Plasmopara halstedii]|eukprot:XP_024574856.1 hypothetical protein PPTG_03081 [Plasmopara halstedii]
MSSSFIASLATAALLFQNVEGHGQMTYPVAREMSPEYHTASGALVNINLSEMQIAPLELLSQNKQADFPPAPWFNLMNGCRGTVYEEGSKFTTLSPGKEFEVKWTIQAPHPGTLKLSILKPSTDAKGVITYESYKLLSEISPFAESGGDGSTSVTMPSDVQCSAPGDCVFQFNWHSDIAKQTYVTCADIVVSGSGASTSTSPSSAKTPTSATPAKSPTAPAASPTPASPATSPTPATHPSDLLDFHYIFFFL